VGGLAVEYLTTSSGTLLPGPVTLDVDIGVSIAIEGGQYGTIADDLAGQGFRRDGQGRYLREIEKQPVFIDFLTEHGQATTGSIDVDGVPAGIFPGINRALATHRKVVIEGKDLYGAQQKLEIPVCSIGPLLVLKLNAFAGRQQPKDAYDILLAISQYLDGSGAAIQGFKAERSQRNPGFARAEATLKAHFQEVEQSGPARCAAFAVEGLGDAEALLTRRLQIAQQVVTFGRALVGMDES